jgi:putative ABC transport system substrate-binding protein
MLLSRHTKRREFITLLGGAAVSWPLNVLAQQASKVWRMGFIAHGHERFYDALFEGLQEFGYVEGQTSSLSADMQRAARSDFQNLRLRWFA